MTEHFTPPIRRVEPDEDLKLFKEEIKSNGIGHERYRFTVLCQ